MRRGDGRWTAPSLEVEDGRIVLTLGPNSNVVGKTFCTFSTNFSFKLTFPSLLAFFSTLHCPSLSPPLNILPALVDRARKWRKSSLKPICSSHSFILLFLFFFAGTGGHHHPASSFLLYYWEDNDNRGLAPTIMDQIDCERSSTFLLKRGDLMIKKKKDRGGREIRSTRTSRSGGFQLEISAAGCYKPSKAFKFIVLTNSDMKPQCDH